MARADVLNLLYSKEQDPFVFNFDNMMAPPVYYFISPMEIAQIHSIVSSLKYSSKLEEKVNMIKQIVGQRGWIRFSSGTNRIIFRHRDYPAILLKIALDKVGLSDSLHEMQNQQLLKPFVCKVYDVTPCGTAAIVERVQPILSIAEFQSIADDVYDLLTTKILGRYVLEDIGTHYYMNWGIRNGFGPVLLDYPYLFELDCNKLFCHNTLPNGCICDGVIDYDAGFNHLVCNKCGKDYLASELQNYIKENKIKINVEESDSNLQVSIKIKGKLYTNRVEETDCIE